MRWFALRCIALVSLAPWGCGSEIATDDAGADAASDGSQTDGAKLDAAKDAATDVNAFDADASSDAPSGIALHFKCAEGDQCDAAAPACCATLSFTNCLLSEVSTQCTPSADCPTTLQPFCAQTEQVRFCDQNADCTEPGYDKCCTFQITGYAQTLVLCASQQMADQVDASCAP